MGGIFSKPESSQRSLAIETPGCHTAVLLFSHRPECEWRNKRFVRQDYAKNRQVADAFYQHTLQAVEESGFPVLEVNDDRQRGDHFGARLANAFADAFAQGYEHVIAVGNDCPRLHEVDWDAVGEHLERGTSIVGPTSGREGTYLIALRRDQFNRRAFAALPWQSPALFDALVCHLSRQTGADPTLLAERDDVNGHRELVALVREDTSLPVAFVVSLRAVLGPAGHATRLPVPFAERSGTPYRSRGPPSFLPAVG